MDKLYSFSLLILKGFIFTAIHQFFHLCYGIFILFMLTLFHREGVRIMATKSFIDTYIIERSDVNIFHNIMSKPKKVKVKKVMNHQDVKGKAIVDMLGIKKS